MKNLISKLQSYFSGTSSKEKRIYLDYLASTPLDPRFLKKMMPYFSVHFGNAGAIHKEGEISKQVLGECREGIAESIQSTPEKIIFTSSGTEGNNLAIIGHINTLIEGGRDPKDIHIITSSAEHPSVLDCFTYFKDKGVSVDMVDFEENGVIDPKAVRAILRKETLFVSISYVNNEIGTVQPLKEIVQEIRAYEKEMDTKIVFHTDASQAPLYLDCIPNNIGVDLMTIDGQKIYGPKGVGFLYKQKDVNLEPIMKGGNQEHGLRPGTENIPLIVGMKESFVEAVLNREKETREISELQKYFLEELKQHIPKAILNGDQKLRSPNNVNVSIPRIDNEYLMIALDERGVAVATKSACLGHGNGKYSYVVSSLYKDKNLGIKMAKSSIRFSFGRGVAKKDIDYVISVLVDEVNKFDKTGL